MKQVSFLAAYPADDGALSGLHHEAGEWHGSIYYPSLSLCMNSAPGLLLTEMVNTLLMLQSKWRMIQNRFGCACGKCPLSSPNAGPASLPAVIGVGESQRFWVHAAASRRVLQRIAQSDRRGRIRSRRLALASRLFAMDLIAR
jgi:hypothetical protein